MLKSEPLPEAATSTPVKEPQQQSDAETPSSPGPVAETAPTNSDEGKGNTASVPPEPPEQETRKATEPAKKIVESPAPHAGATEATSPTEAAQLLAEVLRVLGS